MENVVYKPIPEYPGYWASNDGHIMSQKKKNKKLLSIQTAPNGHKTVIFYHDHRSRSQYVARLVLAAFEGYPSSPELCYVYFKDGDRGNCNLENLKWMVCEVSEGYDPSKSKRKGVLKPAITKMKMTEAKLNQSEETIRKIQEARAETIRKKKEEKREVIDELNDVVTSVYDSNLTEYERKAMIAARIAAIRKRYE